jgi:Fe-S-cluster containining protein
MDQKEAKKLLNDIKTGKHQTLRMNDTFQFKCTSCGKCCFNNEVLLNCYDLIRLRHGLRASTNDILQQKLISFHIGPSSGLPVCMINFMDLASRMSKCPFLAPAIKADVNKRSKSEMKRVLAQGAEIEKWLCAIHKDRPLACRFYPCGRIKKINNKTGNVKSTFILQDIADFCPGFKEKQKQTLKQYLKESDFKQYDAGSAKYASLMERLISSGFFIPTKHNKSGSNDQKPLLTDKSRILFLLANTMYNFDSFNYFSNDERVLKTINDPDANHDDFMYVFTKIIKMVEHLIKLYKENDEDEEAVYKLINSQN